MIHIVSESPNRSTKLSHVLRLLEQDDILVLVSDAVIAATLPMLRAELEQKTILIMQSDVEKRGLSPIIGQLIQEGDLVDLIISHGNPITW